MQARRFSAVALAAAIAFGAGSLATAPLAHAHSVEKCKKQVRNYKKLCKFSPTALIMGMCATKKTLKWCSDKKLHEEKFHK
ncbi:MAG: hypothetical protein Kow0032_22890 [Methyloligellaceae bacterium]|nr:MAG: hypothetical protein D6773_12950 [Alphaproteobacteria bacterium]